LTDNLPRIITTSSELEHLDRLTAMAVDLDEIYARCAEAYPEFDLAREDFKAAVVGAVAKYLVGFAKAGEMPKPEEIRKFTCELQDLDLYLTLACARGSEQAWWHFDREYRSFIERLAHQLVGRGMDANEVIDSVYVELYGTKTVDGVRQSKFKTYTGRGTLRGWLRTVISHAAVDLYRGRQDEIPLEEWSKSGDELPEGQGWRTEAHGSEILMLENVARERYRSVTMAALDQSLATLDAHETLLLLYYHVEGLKLREIARIVESPTSSIRRWFQRRSKSHGKTAARIHESTVMRWLEKVYRKVSDRFHSELKNKHGLNPAEIDICLEIATEDFGQGVGLNLEKSESKTVSQAEGAS
jgi:RNA polymerase sigma-70 factor